jgi:hypothetical protein
MKLERKLKVALDESRLLILGAQVLFGFQFTGIFQQLFSELPMLSRALSCSGLTLLMLTIGLLITPAMQHRIVEGGQDSPAILTIATFFTGWALLPFALALAFDLFVTAERIWQPVSAAITSAAFFVLAILCWYALGFLVQRKKRQPMAKSVKPTPLEQQVEQLLTEARVIIPGAQALLGFQLTVTLTNAFQQLPGEAKIAHAAALCCVALAVVLLMAPASLHRISFAGEDSPEFLNIASAFVIAAPLPVAFAIALDTYVAAGRAVQSETAAALLAVVAIIVLLALWYGYPLWRRMRMPKRG